jgi:hypothetical protein
MAAFEWPVSKIELVNSALAQTGDNLVANADDGSVEWNACSPAYERALAVVTEAHPWSWVTDFRTLQPSLTAPTDDRYDTAYDLPDDLVHLILVRVNDRTCIWDLLNGQIVVNARGGPPPPPTPQPTPFPMIIKGIFSTNSDPVNGTPTVILALERYVMSGIYRGIHKDTTEAGRMFGEANAILANAKARHDMQKPKRALFISRTRRARYIRRPDFPIPSGGDSGPWGL